MKKVVLSILVALCLLIMPNAKADVELPTLTDHEKVTVYLFRSSGCSHCRDFIEYFADNYYTYQDYFEIVTYEVSDADNYNLMLAAKERNGEEADGSVPYIVIGNTFDQLGFGTDGTEVIEAALAAYEDVSYSDMVQEIIEDEDLNPSETSLEEAADYYGFNMAGFDGNPTEEEGLSDGAVVAIIFGILILGFVGLVIYSRKK